MEATQISIWLAFLAGLVSFFSPCVMPLIPAYIAYLAGVGAENRGRLLRNSLGFVLGFTVVFVVLGASATLLGQFLLRHQFLLRKISGVIIMVFGLHLAGLIKIGFLNFDTRKQVKTKEGKDAGFLQSFVFGLAFSSGWTPCIGPILGSILILASTTASLTQGMFLLVIYAVGLGLPFVLTAVLIDRLQGRWSRLTKITVWLSRISGYLLIVLGILMYFGVLQSLAGYLPAFGL